jgi:hypothetical protein
MLRNLQGVDGLGELPGAPGAGAQLAQDFTSFKLGQAWEPGQSQAYDYVA